MRELRGAGVVTVKHVPTDLNPADLFTKVLGRQVFEKFRRIVLNLAGGEAIDQLRRAKTDLAAPPTSSAVARKQKELSKMAALFV